MLRPSACFIAALSFLALMPYGRQASAQRRPPVVRTPITRPPPPPTPDSTPSKPGAKAGAKPSAADVDMRSTMPTISYGPPQPRTITSASLAEAAALRVAAAGDKDPGDKPGDKDPGDKVDPRDLTTLVAGKNVTSKILHLRRLDDIEQSELPDGAKRLLIMHLGTIAADQSGHYIVNPQLAEEWLKTHRVPDNIKPPEKKSSKNKGCSWRHVSTNCAKNEGQQVIDKASEEWENLRQQAEVAWNHAADELAKEWEQALGCFADKTLSLKEIPVQFSIAPTMSIPIDGLALEGKFASGDVKGSLGLGFPMQSDFSAQLDLFYIPCLPFVIRPKALAADGVMTVGEQLKASVTATGKFDKTFTIPPTGGPVIPIQMIPIIIAGVPVAELDVSAYIEGNLQVGGEGKAEASFQLDNSHTAQFAFACDGKGCTARPPQKIPTATTISESAEIEGQVFVKPAIYTALQLNFNYNALSARAGPQPYLLGTVSGCTGVTAQQTLDGGSSSQESHVLAADLDWGVELRAEALIAGQVIGNTYVKRVMQDEHIWFRDLAPGGSTALVAVVRGAPQVTAGKPATYKVKMPSCYPYTTPVQYRVTWTGNAMAAPTNGCNWQKGICKFDPTKDLVISLTWPTAGSYSLTVAPVGDDHGKQLHTFTPAPKATQVEITVAAGG